jgi:hypothetical protein
LFILVVLFFVYKIFRSNKENGYSNWDFITPLYVIGLVVTVILYGGIFWW